MWYNSYLLDFKEYLVENKGLTIFDIDDTMFTSKARVRVKNTRTNKVKELSPKAYNNYKLGKDEEWDYGEFKSSKILIFFKSFIKIDLKRMSPSNDLTNIL